MWSLAKIGILSMVAITLGALHYAAPSHHPIPTNNEPSAASQSLINQDVLYPVEPGAKITQGSLYLVDTQASTIGTLASPLLSTEVNIQVTGIIARTTLTQTFKNTSQKQMHGYYQFPLPENAAVDHLLINLGERKIEGKILPKKVARETFQKVKHLGKKASLIEQHRPNIFSNEISNIAAGETVSISIEYQQKLSLLDNQYSLRFPMAITPRYHPASQTEQSPTRLRANTLSNQKLALQVQLNLGFNAQQIKSENHAVTTRKQSDGHYFVQLSPEQGLGQDFVLNWQPDFTDVPQSSHYRQWVNGEEYGLIMLLPPSKTLAKPHNQARELIFILDTSGSMQGKAIQQAKSALTLAIDHLTAEDSFNVIEFNSYAQNLFQTTKLATAKHKSTAKKFVHSLSANGGTEMRSALDLAFSMPSQAQTNIKAKLRQIIFITDGSVSNEDALMQLIKQRLDDARLFTVGIGDAPNSYFMSEAAKVGRGTFTYIGAVDQVADKMQRLLEKLQYPVITDIKLSADSSDANSSQFMVFYPETISDLYLNEPLNLSYKRIKNNSPTNGQSKPLNQLRIKAKYNGRPWQHTIEVTGTTHQSGLNVLWAREKISQLTQTLRQLPKSKTDYAEQKHEIKQQIIQTALNHHIVSQYTSLLAIEDITDLPLANNPELANQTHLTPPSYGQLPQTATSATLRMLIGLGLILLSASLYLHTRNGFNLSRKKR